LSYSWLRSSSSERRVVKSLSVSTLIRQPSTSSFSLSPSTFIHPSAFCLHLGIPHTAPPRTACGVFASLPTTQGFVAICELEPGKWLEHTEIAAYVSRVKTLNGHFDGRYIVLDEPATLKPNTRVKIIAAENGETEEDLARACARLSEPVFQKIWDNPLDAGYDKL
jgi:hypothetical protein